MRRLISLLSATSLAGATLVVLSAPASADGTGCSYVTRNNSVSAMYGQESVDIGSSGSWTNCSGHTHVREFTIRFSYQDDDDGRDWHDDDDDYIRYSCKAMTDTRVVDTWSGRLDDGNRIDGHDIAASGRMFYPNHPRISCTGTVVQDYQYDSDFTIKGTSI